jgi:hypothetical protein
MASRSQVVALTGVANCPCASAYLHGVRACGIFILFFALSGCIKCRENCIQGQCVKKLCECNLWYTGDRCDRSVLSTWEGTYEGATECAFFSNPAKMSLTADGQIPQRLWVNSDAFYLEFKSNNSFLIPEQNIQGSLYIGEGQMLTNGISFYLSPSGDTTHTACLTQAHRVEVGTDE